MCLLFNSIRSTVTAIAHIIYKKFIITLVWQADSVLIEAGSQI